MNKKRRAQLSKLQDLIELTKTRIDELPLLQLAKDTQAVLDALTELKDAHSEAYDNLSEGRQEGEAGQQMQSEVEALEGALGEIEDALEILTSVDETIKEALDEAFASIEEAKGVED